MRDGDLIAELHALRADVDWPATPDLAAAVGARLEAVEVRGAPRAWRPRLVPRRRARLAAALVAALLLLPAAALAVPASRHAILDALGLRHVTVERRTTPPPARDPRLGDRTTLSRAARAAGFTPRTLTAIARPPDRVYLRGDIITLVYAREHLLLAQAGGRLPREVLHKILGVGDIARGVTIEGAPGLYLKDPHRYQWFDATGSVVRSGPALVWERDGLVLRLEGAPSQARAVTLAASAR
jgi:hypothetical protein